MCGVLDPETVIPQADAELKAAGMDKVIAEKQRQLDELLVQNNERRKFKK
jgi:putative aldouronate transport system substrate-binding protein